MVRIEQCCCSVSYMLECSDRNIPNKAVVKSLIKHKNFLKAYLNSTKPLHNQHYPNDRILAYSILLEYFFFVLPRGHPALYVDPHHCPMLAHSQ